jgi:hypothetical protein
MGTTFVIPMDYVGTSLFARKTYDLPCMEQGDCGGGNETTTFDLRHAPAGYKAYKGSITAPVAL